MRLPLLLAATAALAAPASAETPAEAVVGAEHAFAAAAHDKGITAAFLESIDPERAIRLTPEPKPALAFWQARKNSTGAPYLVWWPTWAGASTCGDLGFDTGPYSYGGKAFGYFFTIWGRRSATGPFKWLLDAGVDRDGDPQVPANAQATYAAAASGKWPAHHHDTYSSEIDRLDASFDAGVARDGKAAYAARLADDARAQGLGLQDPVTGKAAVLAAIAGRQEAAMVHQGSFVSQCGDLAATYGSADWKSLGKLVNGNYVRVWRRAGPRWTLLSKRSRRRASAAKTTGVSRIQKHSTTKRTKKNRGMGPSREGRPFVILVSLVV